ncbi:hypothetical protein ACJJTC_018592 [Scirpophaga incertulas]
MRLTGLQADPSVKVKVEPGLFEFKMWHLVKGMAPFMTPLELHTAGYNVDLDYKAQVELDVTTPETLEEFYERNKKVMYSAIEDSEAEGCNVMFVGHASTLDMAAFALSQWERGRGPGRRSGRGRGSGADAVAGACAQYQVSGALLRVPYCALAALRGPSLAPGAAALPARH